MNHRTAAADRCRPLKQPVTIKIFFCGGKRGRRRLLGTFFARASPRVNGGEREGEGDFFLLRIILLLFFVRKNESFRGEGGGDRKLSARPNSRSMAVQGKLSTRAGESWHNIRQRFFSLNEFQHSADFLNYKRKRQRR